MVRRLPALVLLVTFAGACRKASSEGGFVAVVHVGSAVRADCISVAVIQTRGGDEQSTQKVARKPELRFGVVSGDGLRGEVRVTARGWLGASCSDDAALSLNAESSPLVVTIVPGDTSRQVTLELEGALDDSDHDGYRSSGTGGRDCDDSNDAVNPGADERCTNGRDDDCDQRADCADTPRCDTVSCDDGKACTTNDHCEAGACGGTVTTCGAPPGECFQGAAACTDDGGCAFWVDAGTPCDGGFCRPDGTCAPPNTELDCSDGRDDDGDGLFDCLDVADCSSRACTGSDLCSLANFCLSDGGCTGTPRSCSTPPGSCFVADAGACVAATGECTWPVRAGSCDDGLTCTTVDACLADGGCAGQDKPCVQPDDGGCFAPAGTCMEPAGSCVFPVRAGMSCSDGDRCSFSDMCSVAGACSGTAAPCAAPGVCMQAGTCEGDGGCRYVPQPPWSACDAGLCQPDGGCGPLLGAWPYVPSNFAPLLIPDSGISGPLVIDCGATFNTNVPGFTVPCSGQAAVTPVVVQQDGGPDAVLVPVASLLVTDAGSLRIEGDRPIIFAVYGDALISGLIRASTGRFEFIPGAGGYTLATRGAQCRARAGADGQLNGGGGGGGSGGAVLLEGANVVLTASGLITANGGGGGEGAGIGITSADGQDGQLMSGAPAVGGSSVVAPNGGNGGNGASADAGAGSGAPGSEGGGGGGGGLGRLRVNGYPMCSNGGALISAQATRNSCN